MTEILVRVPDAPPAPPASLGRGNQLAWKALRVIDDKWVPDILGALADGPLRYRELLDAVPEIRESMLTRTLKSMERNGLLTHRVVAAVPVQSIYTLTELGHSLDEPLGVLADWAEAHLAEVEGARLSHDSEAIVRRAYP